MGSNPVFPVVIKYISFFTYHMSTYLYVCSIRTIEFILLKLVHLCCLFITEVIPLLLAIAVITLIERRAMGSVQRRRGPNENGNLGMFQPIADGIKLVLKELFSTSNANAAIFMAAPIYTLFITIFFWCLVPGSQRFAIVELQYVLLIFLIVGTFHVQTIIFAG